MVLNTDALIESGSLEVTEHTLFKVAAWSSAVPADTWWIRKMVDDVVASVAAEPMDYLATSALQTQPSLQIRTEPHWLEFFKFVRSVFDSILSIGEGSRYQGFGVRAWGVIIDAKTSKKDLQYGPARIVEPHNHVPAVLTSVFGCELPGEPAAIHLSTVFHNPARHIICPWQPRVVLVPPAVGKLLVFPGWVEHSAPVVVPIQESQRRIIVSTDYFPENVDRAFA